MCAAGGQAGGTAVPGLATPGPEQLCPDSRRRLWGRDGGNVLRNRFSGELILVFHKRVRPHVYGIVTGLEESPQYHFFRGLHYRSSNRGNKCCRIWGCRVLRLHACSPDLTDRHTRSPSVDTLAGTLSLNGPAHLHSQRHSGSRVCTRSPHTSPLPASFCFQANPISSFLCPHPTPQVKF